MSLIQGLIGSRVNETLDNYSRADQLLTTKLIIDTTPSPSIINYTSDESFWNAIFIDRQRYVNKLFALNGATMSEWVPRVPGLAHKPESRRLLALSTESTQKLVELDGLQVYQPQEKSEHVMSGVGTLRLPPNTNGEWMFSISSKGDASSGVPILVLPDVWDRLQKDNSCEGRLISCIARWQPMAMEWSKHFRSTGDIPPGYFVLNNPDAIMFEDRVTRTWVYPFTIMEYQSSVAELFDYVYCGAHTDDQNFRYGVTNFFTAYQYKFGGAHSRFLIAGDLVEELWPAEYNSPADLLAQDNSARSQLTLLKERVNERMLGKTVLDELLIKMQSVMSDDDLLRLSSEVQIDKRVWQISNTTLAQQCSQFLEAVFAERKQDALLERLAAQKPYFFR